MKKIKEPWTAHILTLFPEMFPGPLGFSIVGKALKEKVWSLNLINLQNFSKKGPKYIDEKPFGGGSGMIIKSEIIHNALNNVIKKSKKKLFINLFNSYRKKIKSKKNKKIFKKKRFNFSLWKI